MNSGGKNTNFLALIKQVRPLLASSLRKYAFVIVALRHRLSLFSDPVSR